MVWIFFIAICRSTSMKLIEMGLVSEETKGPSFNGEPGTPGSV